MFRKIIAAYQIALNREYKHKLQYNQTMPDSNRGAKSSEKRKRAIPWFNLPYSLNVATNEGRQFLNYLDTCFPKLHPLRGIMNRDTVKVWYSTMPISRR